MSGPLKRSFLAVRVTPKASRNEVTGLYTAADGAVSLSVKVTAAPDKGKANRAVTNLLAKKLGVAKSMLTLVKGETDRNKTFQFSGNTEPLEAFIASLSNTGKPMAKIIDGKAYAEGLRSRMAKTVVELKAKHGLTPGLAVVLVGEDPASKVYVANKAKQTVEVGMNSWEHKLPATTSEAELLALVDKLNKDPACHGILVQLPLPKQIDSDKVLSALDPDKDVDGFHVVNVGRLSTGQESLVPCTPVGSVMLAKDALGSLAGLEAVVIGRSNIVGKPVAQLLLAENCTVTIAHSKTKDLAGVVRRADLVIAAVGRPEMVKGDWLKPGACVIDVGINRIERDGKGKLVGDCDFASCERVAGSITPVPGGVGPMTIACLLRNTVRAACAQKGIAIPEM